MASRKPDNFLETCGALSRCLRSVTAQAYVTFEVGSTQAKFLRHIDSHTRISQADLARATQTDPTLTGRVLATLVERGWVRRERSEEDRRQYVLELSTSGRRAYKRVQEAREQVSRRIGTVLDRRDLEDFERVASKVLVALQGS